MYLPEIFELGRAVDDVPGGGRSPFSLAVIHDGKPRGDGGEQGGTVALRPAMMGNNEDLHRSEAIYRTNHVELLVPGQVAKVENSHLAERQHRSQRTGILGLIRGLFFRGCAGSVFRSTA